MHACDHPHTSYDHPICTPLRFFNDAPSLQTQLLEDHIKELKRVLKPGHKRLNWNSLGIGDYITRCDQVCAFLLHSNNLDSQILRKIVRFESLFKHMHSSQVLRLNFRL